MQAQLQAEEQARAAHPAKQRVTPLTEKQLKATYRAFADIPLDSELTSDDDEQQRSILLARKVASEESKKVEADRNRAERERASSCEPAQM